MGVSQPKMIVVNYDKGFAEMSQHPAFRNRRTRTHPVDVDSSLLAPRRPHADSRLRSDARGCDGGVLKSWRRESPCRHWRGRTARNMPPVISTIVMLRLFARSQRTSMSAYFTNSLTAPTGLGLLASFRAAGFFPVGQRAARSLPERWPAVLPRGETQQRFKAINSR